MGKVKTKRLRATAAVWTYKCTTKSDEATIESSGPIAADLGEALRVIQLHITRLSWIERDALFALTANIRTRLKAEREDYVPLLPKKGRVR